MNSEGQLNMQKDTENTSNHYSKNFTGTYGHGEQNYKPGDIMYQGSFCQDWYHLEGLKPNNKQIIEKLEEHNESFVMMCSNGVNDNQFIKGYPSLIINIVSYISCENPEVDLKNDIHKGKLLSTKPIDITDYDLILPSDFDKSLGHGTSCLSTSEQISKLLKSLSEGTSIDFESSDTIESLLLHNSDPNTLDSNMINDDYGNMVDSILSTVNQPTTCQDKQQLELIIKGLLDYHSLKSTSVSVSVETVTEYINLLKQQTNLKFTHDQN